MYFSSLTCSLDSDLVMWYDSLENGEPLQLSQGNDTCYQLFGSLYEVLSEDEFDPMTEENMQETVDYNAPRSQSGAWPYDLGCSLFRKEPTFPGGSSASVSPMVGELAQSSQANLPTDWPTISPVVNCQADLQV